MLYQVKTEMQDTTHPILFIMHENLLQGNNGSVPFGSRFVDLTVEGSVKQLHISSAIPTQRYLLQASPKTQSLEYSSIR